MVQIHKYDVDHTWMTLDERSKGMTLWRSWLQGAQECSAVCLQKQSLLACLVCNLSRSRRHFLSQMKIKGSRENQVSFACPARSCILSMGRDVN